jgi:hypothetical protein
VGDLNNFRVEKFDPSGEFLLMFGGEVNKTTGKDICTAIQQESGDICGAGVEGIGDGEFKTKVFERDNFLTIGPDGSVFVGDTNRIQKFSPAGSFQASIPLPAAFTGESVQMLDTDSAGNFYLTTNVCGGCGASFDVQKLDPNGALIGTRPLGVGLVAVALTVDSTDNLFVGIENSGFFDRREVIQFGPDGTPIIHLGEGFAKEKGSISEGKAFFSGLVTNTVTLGGGQDIYLSSRSPSISYVTGFGEPPTKWPPPIDPPTIEAQYAKSVSSDSAVLGAEINPKFWTDTTYYLEYGLGACAAGDCTTTIPAPPGSLLSADVLSASVKTEDIAISGLMPGQTYHYRFVARGTGSAGAPVRGIGGKVGADGAESVFTTPSTPQPRTDCSNQVFRIGASARLPDCRAYEMVTPINKNGTDIVSLINISSQTAKLDQSSADGEKLAYTTSQGFGDAQGTPYMSQYIASRGAAGWTSHGISPTQGISAISIGKRLDLEFRAFTADLCVAALVHATDPSLAPGATENFANVYRRQNCGSEGYETTSTTAPPSGVAGSGYEIEVQGLSADGRCTAYRGPGTGLYQTCDGETRLLSVSPGGESVGKNAAAGTANGGGAIRQNSNAGAINSNGSRVYWTEAEAGAGPLNLRENANEDQSVVVGGKCTEPQKACTLRISSKAAHFWAASPNGSRAIFTTGEVENDAKATLNEFTAADKKTTKIAEGVFGIMGAGVGATRVYFVSDRILIAGSNGEGKSPVADAPNLYFYDAEKSGEDRFRFIGTLTAEDARDQPAFNYSPIAKLPYKHVSRVSRDGSAVAFMSLASLTGYENIDVVNGKPDAEVFVYRADANGGAGALSCASCNPSGQLPEGQPLILENTPTSIQGAALLPPPESELYGTQVISADGRFVFFNSYEAMLPRDTNGVADVNQWEAPGSGECSEGSPSYSPLNGGCISLISSGESPSDSEFVDASPSGADVFFATASSLVAQDPGLIDIYDARQPLAGHPAGFPPPPNPPAACEGEACQGPLAPPDDPTPASSAFEGPGNVAKKPATKKPVAKKHRKKKKQAHRKDRRHRANDNRRAAR